MQDLAVHGSILPMHYNVCCKILLGVVYPMSPFPGFNKYQLSYSTGAWVGRGQWSEKNYSNKTSFV